MYIHRIQWSLHNSNLYNSNVSLTQANSLAPWKFPNDNPNILDELVALEDITNTNHVKAQNMET